MAEITEPASTLQNRAILRFSSSVRVVSVRQMRMSGWMPEASSSLTECWVGLVFTSPAVLM